MNKKADILVPLFTPFKKDGSVDYEALRKLVRFVLDKGADGIYTGGSSAECFLLTQEERKMTLEVAAREAAGAAIVAHVGSAGTALAEDLARHARSVGADALASVPPFYFRYSVQEIKQYYIDVAQAGNLPIMIYNIPALSGVRFSLEELCDLLADEHVFALKYTAPDFYILNRIKNSVPNKPIYSGMDEAFCSALTAGATRAIGTTMNFLPEVFIQIKTMFEAGKISGAQMLQNRMNNVIEPIVNASTIPAMKYASRVWGVDCGECRKPFRTLTDAEKARIEKALRDNF